ncbi:type II secretion system F family protein [Candidatus Gracilibacteria bacterium]|nr:type II secretion system F family protein [Candidatus Gracilibacteria bacterium]
MNDEYSPNNPIPPTQAQEVEDNFDEIILDIKSEDKATVEEVTKKRKITNLLDVYHFINDWVIDQSPVKLQEKLLFFQLLGAILQAGISIPEALRMLEIQTANQKMKRVIKDVRLLIEDGESLAGAMRRNSDIFDEATCSIVEAGEKSGKLNEVLKELVNQYNRLSSIQKKVKSVLTYPVIVLVVMVLLTVVVVIFVVPKLIELFGDLESLPVPTRILVGASDLVLHKWPLLIGGMGAFISLFLVWKKSSWGKRQWSNFILLLPVGGKMMKGMVLSRVTRIFGFLIASGVPIIEGIKITASTANNPTYEEKLLLASDDLSKGISIAENLSDNEKLFPKMLISMIAIGEKTASLEKIMIRIADFYEEELDRKISMLSKLMEPIILTFIAGGAVFMILAIYLPILQMNDQMLG